MSGAEVIKPGFSLRSSFVGAKPRIDVSGWQNQREIETIDSATSNREEEIGEYVSEEENDAVLASRISPISQSLEDRRFRLVRERNIILSIPFFGFFPKYRKQLVQIDAELNQIDLDLYEIIRSEPISESIALKMKKTEKSLEKLKTYLNDK